MTSDERKPGNEIGEAAFWCARLEREGDASLPEFHEWLERGTANHMAYDAVLAMSKRLESLDPGREIDVEELIARAKAEEAALEYARKRRAERSCNHRPLLPVGWPRAKVGAAAVAVAAIVIVGWAELPMRSTQTYGTGFGELRSIKLADGSVVHLNGGSMVKVYYSREERHVLLLSGEAQFIVEHDASRPFRVGLGRFTVQAVGTQFDVYRQNVSQQGLGATISVIAGEVSVLFSAKDETTAEENRRQYVPSPGDAPEKLVAGEQLRIGADGGFDKVRHPDLSNITLWPQRRVAFNRTPLWQVALEFNRYNTEPIEVDGEALRSRLVDGRYSVDHPESLFAILQEDDPRLTVTRRDGKVVLSSR